MIRIALQTCLTVMALLISASVSLAATCESDPNECTPKKLCKEATNIKGGNTVWSTASGSANYVRFAQGLGMSCGVVAIVEPCDLDPNECKISQLCKKATKSNGEQTVWNSAAQSYVDVAKEYGMSCDVVAQTTSSPENITALLATAQAELREAEKISTEAQRQMVVLSESVRELQAQIGGLQSILSDYRRRDEKNNIKLTDLGNDLNMALAQAASEARKNLVLKDKIKTLGSNLNMALAQAASEARKNLALQADKTKTTLVTKDCSASSPEMCSTELLCVRATSQTGSAVLWTKTSSLQTYVLEAKKRGLNCGVGDTTTSVTKTCTSMAPQFCADSLLCNRATTEKANSKKWQTHYGLAYVKEAKKRGLSCNVNDQIIREITYCHNDITACDNNSVCQKSTFIEGNKKYWWPSPSFKDKYQAEARRRGLSCEVSGEAHPGFCGMNNAQACDDQRVCVNAITGDVKNPIWSTLQSNEVYRKEAKKRGLTCGVKATTSSVTKTCSTSTPEACSVTAICKLATLGSGESKTWALSLNSRAYVKEAKKRGLNCGVITQTTSGLPNCKGSYNASTWTNCFGTYTYGPNSEWAGDKYVGEYKDGKQNGQGTKTYASGDKYVGEYKGGKRSGQGTYTWTNGNKYVGEYKDGKRNGQGTYTFASGNKYVGEYKNDKRNGQGFYIWKDGSADFCVYVDDEDSNCSGSNVYDVAPVLTDKFRQLSEYQRRKIQSNLKSMDLYSSTIDRKWGRGTFVGLASYAALNLKTVNINNSSTANTLLQKVMAETQTPSGLPNCPSIGYGHNCFGTWSDGAGYKYVGEWQNNKQHGQGIFTWSAPHSDAGAKYVGEFRDGKRNGQGTFTFSAPHSSAGEKYVGEFRDGKRNGQGTATFSAPHSSAGAKYVGEFRDGKRNGQGTVTFSAPSRFAGQKYVGEFRDEKYNGQGTFTWSDGENYVGEFKDDKYNGQGTKTYANGDQYIGNYLDNARHGRGTQTYANGSKYVGEWRDDKRNGQGTFKLKSVLMDDIIQEGLWKDDVFQGENELQISTTNELSQTLCPGSPYDISQKPDVSKDWNACLGEVHWEYSGGGSYVGEFENGAWHGQGTFKQSPNEEYVGEWQNDQPHGQGTYTYADGTINEGKWKNGEFQN
jgi:hypothetical protein